jgi:hypothetical protein
MKTIKVNPEFASELVCVIPYVYWLHQRGELEKVITSKGMKPFYYFCDNVEERFDYRTFDINQNGLNDVPNNWIHHNTEAVFGKTYDKMTEDEQTEANGVLDYSQFTPPPYRKEFKSNSFDNIKPYVVINNNYNIEFGNDIKDSRRYFDLQTLSVMFYYFYENNYNVIYKRPNNTEFTLDQNEMATLHGGYEFKQRTDAGIITDYELCDYYDNVFNMNELFMEHNNYNEFQLKCFSNAEGFITTNGGGGILTCYFDKKVLFYVPHGKELRDGYLTKENSYVNKLSDSKVHVVLDDGDTNDYTKILNKMKDIF